MTKEEWLRSFTLTYRVNTGHSQDLADKVADVCFDLMGIHANPSMAANFVVQPEPDLSVAGQQIFANWKGDAIN